MKIAVNTRLLLTDKLEGIGWFTYETLRRITEQHPEDDFIFIFDRPYASEFVFSSNVTPVVIGPPARHPILFRIWFDWSVAYVLKKHQPDVFLSPDGYLSLRTNIPSLAVIHDLNFEHYPEDLRPVHAKYYRKFFPLFAKKAKRIATVSEYSKNDISKLYGIALSKIDVVYNGVGAGFFPIRANLQEEVKKEYTSGLDYFLFVGSLHPRKNISRLFSAFDKFKSQTKSKTKMVIVGDKYWWNAAIEKTFNQLEHKRDIIFTGRKNQKELNKLYGAALALCFVPYFEGFGIPIVEAFKCETAVITSNVTSMPEVAGDAALLVDPFDVEKIANAMQELWQKPDLRQELVNRGKLQMTKFSWEKSAERLWESIRKTHEG